jgi:chitin disaccharide deacetylase
VGESLGTVTLIADDYAMTVGVSRGILRLMEHGRISGTGAMTNRPHWRGWSHALRAFHGHADIGIHLNLTLGAPLTEMPRLAPTGELPAIGELAKLALSLRVPKAELMAEIAAQIDAFEQAMGHAPDFIDGHQHAHGLPGVRRALLDVLERRYPKGQRPWLRDPADVMARVVKRGRFVQKALAIGGVTSGFGGAARRAGFLTNDGFAGFSSFDLKEDMTTMFRSYLTAPGPRHLVMCHPGELDEELPRIDPVVATRPIELAYYLSDTATETMAAMGMSLARLRPLAS